MNPFDEGRTKRSANCFGILYKPFTDKTTYGQTDRQEGFCGDFLQENSEHL